MPPKPPERVVYAPLAPVTANGPASSATNGDGGAIELPEAASTESVPTRLPSHIFPLAVRRVVIDPGHGGTDEGTKTAAGLTEKILTLDLAQRLALKLVDAGFDVALTRDTDSRMVLRDRVRFANDLHADLFVSIHVNWFHDGRKNRGIETYYLGPSDDPYVTALASAENRDRFAAVRAGRAMPEWSDYVPGLVDTYRALHVPAPVTEVGR